jgi:hypothetical protein
MFKYADAPSCQAGGPLDVTVSAPRDFPATATNNASVTMQNDRNMIDRRAGQAERGKTEKTQWPMSVPQINVQPRADAYRQCGARNL